MHGSKHTIEFNRNRIQWERVIRKPGHNTFNSVFRETSQVQCLPASNIWERRNNVEANPIQFTKLFIVSHEPHGDWFAFRSCQRFITEKGVEKLPATFRRSSAVATRPRHEVGEADQHPWSYMSFVQDLTIERQVSSHSSFRQVATLGSRHGMIPFPFQVGMCLLSPEPASAAILLLQWGASSGAAVAPATIIYAQSPLSRERMRLAETNRMRLQIEQLRYHCESDARWISLISDTMRHVFRFAESKRHVATKKGQGPEPGAMRHHVGCVHKHHFSICATMFLAGSGPNNVSCRDGEPRPRRGGSQSNTTREKVGSKLRETLIHNITRLLKRFHGFASSWSLLNQGTKRCCVSRDFTAARCDNKATKCTWLSRVSKTARVTLKITKHEIPRKSSRTRAETNRER